MELKIVRETGYLKVELLHRETAEEMREAMWTILGECRRLGVSAVIVYTRASRPLSSSRNSACRSCSRR